MRVQRPLNFKLVGTAATKATAAGREAQPARATGLLTNYVADGFIARATGPAKIKWVIHIDPAGEHDPKLRCKHVNFVANTHVEGEAEFLFALYSVFTVRSVTWAEAGSPHRVELDAAVDTNWSARICRCLPVVLNECTGIS